MSIPLQQQEYTDFSRYRHAVISFNPNQHGQQDLLQWLNPSDKVLLPAAAIAKPEWDCSYVSHYIYIYIIYDMCHKCVTACKHAQNLAMWIAS